LHGPDLRAATGAAPGVGRHEAAPFEAEDWDAPYEEQELW